jgi:hypothetical protein
VLLLAAIVRIGHGTISRKLVLSEEREWEPPSGRWNSFDASETDAGEVQAKGSVVRYPRDYCQVRFRFCVGMEALGGLLWPWKPCSSGHLNRAVEDHPYRPCDRLRRDAVPIADTNLGAARGRSAAHGGGEFTARAKVDDLATRLDHAHSLRQGCLDCGDYSINEVSRQFHRPNATNVARS